MSYDAPSNNNIYHIKNIINITITFIILRLLMLMSELVKLLNVVTEKNSNSIHLSKKLLIYYIFCFWRSLVIIENQHWNHANRSYFIFLKAYVCI